MFEETKNRWVAELRSGKHKQARHQMKDTAGGMCCLGVLQEVVLGLPITRGSIFLSDEARQAAGLRRDDGRCVSLSAGYSTFYPTGENDGDPNRNCTPKTFPEIADLIEQYWQDM